MYTPSTNELIENFNLTLKIILKVLENEDMNVRLTLEVFLKQYQATSPSWTSVSPHKMMFKRKILIFYGS